MTDLIGRDAELVRLRAWMAGSGTLLTLLGPPGIGKTSLARALGLPFFDVSEARTEAELIEALHHGLHLPGTPSPANLKLGLAFFDCLVLDNFEQLVETGGPLLRRLLDEVAGLRLLVTSRRALQLSDEQVLEVPPLRPADAEALLLAAVRRRHARFRLRDDDQPELATLLGRLEGVPLALEMAASRMGLLGVRGLLKRLADPLPLLRLQQRDRPARQRSLGAALQTSWGLLSPAGQQLLQLCASFRGGFDADLIEYAAEHPECAGLSVLDGLQELLDHSLLVRGEEGRLGLLLTVRAFAEEAPGPLDQPARWAAHAVATARRGRQWLDELDGPRCREARMGLIRERPNLRTALDRAAAAPGLVAPGIELDLAIALRPAHLGQLPADSDDGPLVAAIERVQDQPAVPQELLYEARLALSWTRIGLGDAAGSLAALGEDTPAHWRGARQLAISGAHWTAGRLKEAEQASRSAVQLLDRRPRWRARACYGLALALHDSGRRAEAEPLYREALALAVSSGNLVCLATCRNNFARYLFEDGQCAAALEQLRSTADIGARVDHPRLQLVGCVYHAHFLAQMGALDEPADRELRQVVARGQVLAARTGHRAAASSLYEALGNHLLDRGAWEEAGSAFREAIAALGTTAAARNRATGQVGLGLTDLEAGRTARARETLGEAHRFFVEIGDQRIAGILAAHLALAAALMGERRDFPPPVDQSAELLEVHARLVLGDRVDPVPVLLGALQRQGQGPALVRQALLPRLAARRLLQALPPAQRRDAWAAATDPDSNALLLHSSGRASRGPGGSWQDWSSRPLLWRLLLALVEARPAALDQDALLAVGWPGQRILPGAARNRLHKSLALLRKGGLAGLIERSDAGWRIAEGLPVRILGPRDGW